MGKGELVWESRGLLSHLRAAYLYVVVPVVVKVQHTINLRIPGHVELVCTLNTFADCLPRVLLHLNIVELAAKREKIENY